MNRVIVSGRMTIGWEIYHLASGKTVEITGCDATIEPALRLWGTVAPNEIFRVRPILGVISSANVNEQKDALTNKWNELRSKLRKITAKAE